MLNTCHCPKRAPSILPHSHQQQVRSRAHIDTRGRQGNTSQTAPTCLACSQGFVSASSQQRPLAAAVQAASAHAAGTVAWQVAMDATTGCPFAFNMLRALYNCRMLAPARFSQQPGMSAARQKMMMLFVKTHCNTQHWQETAHQTPSRLGPPICLACQNVQVVLLRQATALPPGTSYPPVVGTLLAPPSPLAAGADAAAITALLPDGSLGCADSTPSHTQASAGQWQQVPAYMWIGPLQVLAGRQLHGQHSTPTADMAINSFTCGDIGSPSGNCS